MREIFSPLRYPGGKTKTLEFIKVLIASNFSKRISYIEPYAGGAGVALGLLLDGVVDEIHINDADPAIYSFWQSILESPEKFIRKIKKRKLQWRNGKSNGKFIKRENLDLH